MRTLTRTAAAAAASVALVLALAGCATPDGPGGDPTDADATPTSELTGTLTIYAAASLGAAFDEIAERFEELNPGVHIAPISYDGSSTLVTQIIEGAPADVFASADQNNMQKLVDAGLATAPELFATNTLVIAMPPGNPGSIENLADLAGDSVTVVLCAPEVPCGAASQTLLANEGVVVTPASLEQNVTAVLTKVVVDEADAGLVYATDVQGRDDLESIVPEGADQVVNRYPIVALDDAENAEVAAAFIAFVLSDEGPAILAELGFGAP